MVAGTANAYGLNTLQERAELFVAPGDEVYEGMIVGENSRDNDMAVNPTKEKKLTNMRATRQRREHPAQAAAPDDAGNGAGVHRGRRAGRSHARQNPPAQNRPFRTRPASIVAGRGKGLNHAPYLPSAGRWIMPAASNTSLRTVRGRRAGSRFRRISRSRRCGRTWRSQQRRHRVPTVAFRACSACCGRR